MNYTTERKKLIATVIILICIAILALGTYYIHSFTESPVAQKLSDCFFHLSIYFAIGFTFYGVCARKSPTVFFISTAVILAEYLGLFALLYSTAAKSASSVYGATDLLYLSLFWILFQFIRAYLLYIVGFIFALILRSAGGKLPTWLKLLLCVAFVCATEVIYYLVISVVSEQGTVTPETYISVIIFSIIGYFAALGAFKLMTSKNE